MGISDIMQGGNGGVFDGGRGSLRAHQLIFFFGMPKIETLAVLALCAKLTHLVSIYIFIDVMVTSYDGARGSGHEK